MYFSIINFYFTAIYQPKTLNFMKKILYSILAVLVISLFSCEKKQIVDFDQDPSDLVKSEIGEPIPGQYIVILTGDIKLMKSSYSDVKERTSIVTREAMDVLNQKSVSGKSLEAVYASSLKGFSVSMTEDEAKDISGHKNVAGVYQDRLVVLKKPGTVPTDPPAQTVPYGISRVGNVNYTGSNVAWIIDTGIDLDHPDLNVDTDRSTTFVVRTYTAEDDNGHGSHCAGIVAAIDNEIGVVGVAAGATVVGVKVLNKRGSGTMTDIIAGVDYVAANAADGDVANMSLGGGVYEPLDLAVQALGESGVFVALAAGNESEDANTHSPARANGTNLYTVSAMDINDYWAYFSNYGNPPIDYCAPGLSIFSTYKSGGYATMSGTSMAAPHVCGLLLVTGGNITTDGYVVGDPDGNPDPIAHK